jgi:hypothetical protein
VPLGPIVSIELSLLSVLLSSSILSLLVAPRLFLVEQVAVVSSFSLFGSPFEPFGVVAVTSRSNVRRIAACFDMEVLCL